MKLLNVLSVTLAVSFVSGCKSNKAKESSIRTLADDPIPEVSVPNSPHPVIVNPDEENDMKAPEDMPPKPPVSNPKGLAFAPAEIFGHHMVLQRDASVPFFGTGPDGAEITVTVRDKSYKAVVANEKWRVNLDSAPAGGPYPITIQGPGGSLQLSDVMYGDVYLCSGQSNMSFGLSRAENGAAEVKAANAPDIRIFWNKFYEEGDTSPSNWQPTTSKTSAEFSAVCYYFAREIQKKLNIPIGLLRISLGGVRIQTWMSKATLESIGYFKPDELKGKYTDDTYQYENSIKPILPFRLKGVVWYHGESNTGKSANYQLLLKTMIASWRSSWEQPTLPFLIAQLSAHAPDVGSGRRTPDGDNWAKTRDDQLRVVKADPATALTVTMDQGEEAEIHYPRKKVVGQRLAENAFQIIYKTPGVHQGPIVKKVTRKDASHAKVEFDFAGSGLVVRNGALAGFEVCNANYMCSKTTAATAGDTVVVTTSSMANAATVRYGFRNFPKPEINLYNKEGFQASPFSSKIQ